MLLAFLMTIHLIRTTFCEMFSCEHYLSRRVVGVFHYDRNNRYRLTFMEARLACERDFGATIANRKQLQAANEGGMEECRAGWISEAEVAYPRVHRSWNCGQNQTGIISYGVRKDLLEKWDVFCYKMDGDCATLQEAESPGLPSLELRGNGFSENVRGHFYGATAEHSKTIQKFQEGQSLGPAEYSNPVTAHVSDKKDYMTYTSGLGTESLSLSNGLTRGNRGSSNINNNPGHESESSKDGQTLSISLSAVLQADRAKDKYQTSSGGNSKSLDSTTWQMQSTRSQIAVPLTNISGNKPASFEISDSQLVSARPLSSNSSVTDSGIQLKQTEETGIEYLTPNKENNQSATKVKTLFFELSPPITAYQPSQSFETIPVPTSQTFTIAPDVKHTPAAGTFETFSDKGLIENLEPTSSIATASFHLGKTSSNPSGHIAGELELESQQSENMDKSKSKVKSESTGNNLSNTDEFHSTNISPVISSLGATTVGGNLGPASTAPMEMISTPSLTVMTTYQNAQVSFASPVNESDEAVSFVPQIKGQRPVHQQKIVGEPSTDIHREVHKMGYEANVSIAHVQEKRPLVHTTAVTTLSHQTVDKNQTSNYFETRNETQLAVTVEGLDCKTVNVSNGTAESVNQSCAGGNATRNASCLAALQLLQEDIQPKETSSRRTQTSASDVTHAPVQLDRTQEATSVLHRATLISEGFTSTAVSPVEGGGTHTPALTSLVTDTTSQGALHDIETTNWMSSHFTIENRGYASQTTTAQFDLEGSFKPTDVVTASTVTSPHLDSIIGITGEAPETTTTISKGSNTVMPNLENSKRLGHTMSSTSCGGWLNEEDGRFQSPGFPYAYPSDMDCTWVIFVQEGHLVQLNFHSMVLEEHRGCRYDYVTVFDGRASEKQELGRFCGSELPPPLRSSSNTMTVQMRSDSSVELDGFSVHFHAVKSPGRVRLRGGVNQFGGRVEVDVEGVRGGVCAKHWGSSEAAVVCRQLGFLGNAVATRMVESVEVSVSLVKCRGDELSLDQCETKRGGGCSTVNRAAVHCQVVESCSVLRDSGVLESGTYIIDPDGPRQGQNPFPVHCDMDSQPGAGVTVVSHNSESRVRAEPCEEAGCYSREVVYRHASLLQLRALIHTSLSCSQSVKLECRHIRFLGARWGWWTSWDGRRVDSWGGATTGSRRCACGERGDCDLGLSTCNCDANDEVWRSDDGFLSDMVLLPVREVRFGDTRDVPMEMAFHTIGPLQCWGHKSREPVLVSCAALKEAGITQSGRYLIDPDGTGHGVSQFEVYCDMTSDPLTGVTVVGHDGEGRARVPPCEEPGCYSRELHYEADMPQLRALVRTSASCRQHVKLDCRHTRFVESGWGWWETWAGQKRLDWGGAANNSGSCACGMAGTCDRPGLLCNCDSNDHIWRSDEGFLTDRSALPVRAVYFGDAKDVPLEMAFHTIGKFTCRGTGYPIL